VVPLAQRHRMRWHWVAPDQQAIAVPL